LRRDPIGGHDRQRECQNEPEQTTNNRHLKRHKQGHQNAIEAIEIGRKHPLQNAADRRNAAHQPIDRKPGTGE
jgi:hypothetical protein